MLNYRSTFSVAALLLASIASVQATESVLVDSDFSTGLDGWKTSAGQSTATWGGAGDQALLFTSTRNWRGVMREFESVELKKIGDSIHFSLSIKATEIAASADQGLRITVGDLAKLNGTDRGGYVFMTSWGTPSEPKSWLGAPTNAIGGASSYSVDGSSQGIILNGLYHNLSMTISRESVTELRFVLMVDGIVAGSDIIAASPDVFNVISVNSSVHPNGFNIDDAKVVFQAIPESTTYALILSFSIIGFALVRRRIRF